MWSFDIKFQNAMLVLVKFQTYIKDPVNQSIMKIMNHNNNSSGTIISGNDEQHTSIYTLSLPLD